MTIDLFEFARQNRSTAGSVALTELPRIDTPDRATTLAWSATGSPHGRHGGLRLDLAIDGAVTLICQRCLQSMREPVALRSRFLIAPNEETAEALDQDDDYDVIVGSDAFDLTTLIEDEVILALPIAPRHAVCPDGTGTGAAGSQRPSPFAALAGLKIANGGARDGDGE